jgi:hypothetical protein
MSSRHRVRQPYEYEAPQGVRDAAMWLAHRSVDQWDIVATMARWAVEAAEEACDWADRADEREAASIAEIQKAQEEERLAGLQVSADRDYATPEPPIEIRDELDVRAARLTSYPPEEVVRIWEAAKARPYGRHIWARSIATSADAGEPWAMGVIAESDGIAADAREAADAARDREAGDDYLQVEDPES